MNNKFNKLLIIRHVVNTISVLTCFVLITILLLQIPTVENDLPVAASGWVKFAPVSIKENGQPFQDEEVGNIIHRPTRGSGSGSRSQLVRSVKPSVFRILLTDKESLGGSGSGFCVGRDLVVTNSHVVMNANNEIEEHVFVVDFERNILPVYGIAYRDSVRDIAVLLLKNKLSKNRVLPLLQGNLRYKSDLQQGDELTVTGHPLGLDFSLSTCHVSGVRSSSDLGDELSKALEGT